MRIGIDARCLGPAESGPGIYARQLTERLSALAPDWTLQLYWGKREAGTVIPGRSNVHGRDLGLPGGRKLGNLVFEQILLPKALVEDRCDLLWSPAFVLPVRKTTRQVVTMHDVIPLIFAEQESRMRRLVYHRLLAVNAARADRILTVSRSSADDLVEHLGIDRGKIKVIPNGLESGFSPLGREEIPDLERLLNRFGIERPYGLFTAGMLPRKNAHGVLEAFLRIAGEAGQSRISSFVFTGKCASGGNGPYVERLRSLARDGGMSDRVRFVGFRTRDEIRFLYGGASFSIDASFYEGFGFPVLESMACGCPVITSDVSSLPEVTGDAAWRVDPESVDAIASAMVRVTTDSALSSELRRRGLVRARAFSWDEGARVILAVFRDVLGVDIEAEEIAA